MKKLTYKGCSNVAFILTALSFVLMYGYFFTAMKPMLAFAFIIVAIACSFGIIAMVLKNGVRSLLAAVVSIAWLLFLIAIIVIMKRVS